MPKISEERYIRRLKKIKEDKELIPENKKIILEYLEDCKRGMHRKKIGTSRRYKYAYVLPNFSKEFKKPFDKITVKDLENFLDNGGQSPDKRKVLKTFGKWLIKNNYDFPDVSNIDATEEVKEIPALTKDEIEKMTDISKIKGKAIFWFLFDAGCRAEEFLQTRIEDLTEKQNPDGRGTYYTIRFKHEHSKTKGRTISLPIASPYIKRWLATLKDKKPTDTIFDIGYSGLKLLLGIKGKQALNKRVWCHLLRHSSATYYVTKLNYGSFCYRYGWTITSREPQRYVDREGLAGEEEKTTNAIQNEGYMTLKKENDQLQEKMTLIGEENTGLKTRFDKMQKQVSNMPQQILNLIKENPKDLMGALAIKKAKISH